jgi:hypothetical protein
MNKTAKETSNNMQETGPKSTTKELGNLIWDFYQGDSHGEKVADLLSAILSAGKLELVVEVLKLKELREISGSIDKIAVEGISVEDGQFQQLMTALAYLQSD